MVSHPNRGKGKGHSANPNSHDVIAFRVRHKLTAHEAAALVYATATKWLDWESGKARMHPGLWELARIKTTLGPEIYARLWELIDTEGME